MRASDTRSIATAGWRRRLQLLLQLYLGFKLLRSAAAMAGRYGRGAMGLTKGRWDG